MEVEVKTAVIKQIKITTTVYIEKLMAKAEVKYIQIINVLPFDPFNQSSYQPIISPSVIY